MGFSGGVGKQNVSGARTVTSADAGKKRSPGRCAPTISLEMTRTRGGILRAAKPPAAGRRGERPEARERNRLLRPAGPIRRDRSTRHTRRSLVMRPVTGWILALALLPSTLPAAVAPMDEPAGSGISPVPGPR